MSCSTKSFYCYIRPNRTFSIPPISFYFSFNSVLYFRPAQVQYAKNYLFRKRVKDIYFCFCFAIVLLKCFTKYFTQINWPIYFLSGNRVIYCAINENVHSLTRSFSQTDHTEHTLQLETQCAQQTKSVSSIISVFILK